MKQRREEVCGRAISSEVRRRGARLERDKVYIIAMHEEQDILKAEMGRDGEPPREIRGGPFAVVDGMSTRRVGGKRRLGSRQTGAGARELRQRGDRTKTRMWDLFAGGGNTLTQSV